MWTTVEQPAPRTWSPLALARRVIGFGLLAAVAVSAVLFAVAVWNPWRLVFLEYTWFGNPMIGLLAVPAVALVGLWLALPITQETTQRGRIGARAAALTLTIAGVFGFGVFGDHFTFTGEPVARSADGTWTAAIIRDRGTAPNSYVRIWTGSGITAREVSDLGRVCGSVGVRFSGPHQVELDTSFGTWRIDLDPATGESRQVLGSNCAAGPVPR